MGNNDQRKAHKRKLLLVRSGLADTVKKLRREIDGIQSRGGIPHDYSLGFANGMIFAEHHINSREGKPQMYDRTTSVGKMVRPVALIPDGVDPRGMELELLYNVACTAFDALNHDHATMRDLEVALDHLFLYIEGECKHTLPDAHRAKVLERVQKESKKCQD